MRVLSEMDRFHVAKDAAVAVYGDKASEFAAKMDEMWNSTTATSVNTGKIFLKL